MIVKFDMNIESRIGLSIEADSVEEAIEKVKSMSLSELVESEDFWEKDVYCSDIDTEVYECDVTYAVTDITYENDEDEEDVIAHATRAKAIAELPTSVTVTCRGVRENDDVEFLISDEIWSIVGEEPKTFNYKEVSRT